uniref:MD-2-related lipid-recognition domain-containing protein n=1 Tax=Anopheles epiroticus TaxID=199890 RepID=A0A182PKB4_9DIPT
LLASLHSGSGISDPTYTFKVKKYVCIDTPYPVSTLYTCKSILRRNAPTLVNVSINVPKIYSNVIIKILLFYKFSTYQPFMITVEGDGCEFIRNPPQYSTEKYVYDVIQETLPELLVPCPTGNRTYNFLWHLEERHTPKNIPPGDYKLQFKLIAPRNSTIFAMDVYVQVRISGIVSSFMTQ